MDLTGRLVGYSSGGQVDPSTPVPGGIPAPLLSNAVELGAGRKDALRSSIMSAV